MSYLVLARKWRPTGFDEVIGQDHVTRTLSNAIRMDRVAHAFLFTGARGVGKTSTARILAKALNCQAGPTPEPCGECNACREIPLGTAIDVLEIDGASNRGIGEIRELREGIKYAPSRDRYKIYIIDEVHMLTSEAFNALLKTLEEPPAHVKFIFATTEPQKIPVTILSRCQRFDFKRVPASALTARLVDILKAEDVHMDEAALHIIARESEGSMRDAMSLLDRVISFAGNDVTGDQIAEILGVADRRWLHDLVDAVLGQDAATALAIVNDVHQYGFDIQHFAAELARFLRDLLVIRVSGAGEQLTDLSQSEYQTLVQLGGRRSADDLLSIFRVALRAAEEVAHSRFPKLTLEMAVIRMAGLRPLQPLDELLGRLEELERKLPDGFVLPSGSVQPPRAELMTPRGPAPSPAPRPSLRLVQQEEQLAPPAQVQALTPPAPTRPEVPPTPPRVEAPRVEAPRVEAPAPVQGHLLAPASLRPFEAWLAEADPPLAGQLAQAALSTDAGELLVAFKDDLFLSSFQHGSAAWERLAARVQQFFGDGTRPRVCRLDNGAETTWDRLERERVARIARREAEARQHPAVAALVAAFEGTVRRVVVHDDLKGLGAAEATDEAETS
ncbi:MAG: hypothetical protein AMXMBFR64_54050 [Myxococcales bacterium]